MGDWPFLRGGGHEIDETFQLIGGVVQMGVMKTGALPNPGHQVLDLVVERSKQGLIIVRQVGKERLKGFLAWAFDRPGQAGLDLETLTAGIAEGSALAADGGEGGYDNREPGGAGGSIRVQQGEQLAVVLKLAAEGFNQFFDMFVHQSLSGRRARP